MRDGAVRNFLRLAGTIFALVACAHALRLFLAWPVAIAGWLVPMWLSWLALALTALLSIWAFGLAARLRR